MRTGWMVLTVLAAMGCHARFKNHAHLVEAVRPDVLVTTGPSVTLGGASGDGVVSAVVNVVQAVKSVQTANRLGDRVDIAGVNQAFTASLVETLGGGPPFPTSTDKGSALLQVEVIDYGLESPGIGLQGTFNYDLHVSIYLPSGQKIYNAREACNVSFGDAAALVQVLGLVNNVRQLNKMTDAEVQATFEGAARYCGQELVMKIRRHASSNKAPPSMAGMDVPQATVVATPPALTE